jgi:carboxypeptidase PM20D1
MVRRTGVLLTLIAGLSGPAVAQAPPDRHRLDAATNHLSQAIRIPTVSYDPLSATSRATFQAFQAFLTEAYPNAARTLRREVLANGALLYTWPGRDARAAPIIIAAHQDVVPIEAATQAQWRQPPFGGVVADGQVWGRGALDMKVQLIAVMEAVDDLARRGFAPERTLYLAFGADEETSGSGAQAIAALLKARGVHAEFILDEGPGVIEGFELTGRRDGFIGVAEKGYGTLVVTARDQAGHASVPPLHPGIERLAQAIVAVRGVPLSRRVDGVTRRTLETLAPELPATTRVAIDNLWLTEPLVRAKLRGMPGGDALIGTTVAPTMLSGSPAENVMPGTATATFNIRFHPRDQPDQVLTLARRAVASIDGVSVAWAGPPTPASRVSSSATPAYRLIEQQARSVIGPGSLKIAPLLVFGATDSRFYRDVASDAYRFQPIVVSAAEMSSVHGVNERISVANLARSVRFFDAFIPLATRRRGAGPGG